MKNIMLCSGGKDSVAMLFKCLENKKKYPIDKIVFCDTGFEFDYMYDYLDLIDKRLKGYNLKITRIGDGVKTWKKWSKGRNTKGNYEGRVRGFPPVVGMSWCTRELKVNVLDKYLKEAGEYKKYIGIAYDEQKRITKDPNIIYPLNELLITEKESLQYTKDIGLYNNLYDDFMRLGCYSCPKQGEKSIQRMIDKYPDKWDKIKEMEKEYIKADAIFPLFKQEGTEYYEKLSKIHNSQPLLKW